MSHQWDYVKDNGPAKWAAVAPAAKGWHQSPVDIVTAKALQVPALKTSPLKITYVPANSKKLLNNGHSIQVVIDGKGSSLEGGPYHQKYSIEQFHFHWGKASTAGAEHLVNGKAYAAELHLVHWNTELCSSFAEAVKCANGLAVLGIFLEVGPEHAGLKKLIDLYGKVPNAGDSMDIPGGFDPACLLPADKSKYWTYCGSLTTPPCYESVRFLIFKDPIKVSEQQLNAFRQLNSFKKGDKVPANEFGGKIIENYRPVMPMNDRVVMSSF